MEQARVAREALEHRNHSGETRAADASIGQTKSTSKDHANAEESKAPHSGGVRNADGHSTLKVNDKKEEILHDDLGKF
jgi:hypothetical protein